MLKSYTLNFKKGSESCITFYYTNLNSLIQSPMSQANHLGFIS